MKNSKLQFFANSEKQKLKEMASSYIDVDSVEFSSAKTLSLKNKGEGEG